MKWFKKIDPRVTVILPSGQPLRFEDVGNNLGIYPPEGRGISEMLIGEIRGAIQLGRGGITEITQAEYEALIDEKKNNPDGLKPRWREEWSPRISLAAALAPDPSGPSPIPLPITGAGPAADNAQTVQPAVPAGAIPRPTATKR